MLYEVLEKVAQLSQRFPTVRVDHSGDADHVHGILWLDGH